MKLFTHDDLKKIHLQTIEQENAAPQELLQRMAEAVAGQIMPRRAPARPLTLFAGPGDNGAVALLTALILYGQGYAPLVYLFNINGASISYNCRQARDRVRREAPEMRLVEVIKDMEPPEMSERHLVVDGLFDTELAEPLTGGFSMLVRQINESGAEILSIAIPSGLLADWNPSTIARNVIQAHTTCALQLPPLSSMFAENSRFYGEVVTPDVGLSRSAIERMPSKYRLITEAEVRTALRPRDPFSSKADYGRALIVAGSYGMLGAAALATRAALRSGAGIVTLHAPACAFIPIQTATPEAIYEADDNERHVTAIPNTKGYNAIGIGPGLGRDRATADALESLISAYRHPMVVDADALNILAERNDLIAKLPKGTVITPHAGEFDRLFGMHTTGESRLLAAVEMARRHSLVIVLKGRYTATVRPDGHVFFNSTGNAGMATPGAGDVLTGVITALMAQGYTPDFAAFTGVWVHGQAGDIARRQKGVYGLVAQDIVDSLPEAFKTILP